MLKKILNPKAVIFDMDGLLVDSEPLWEKAQIKVFEQLGIKMTVELCYNVKGMRVDEAMKFWHDMFKWEGKSLELVENEIMDEMAKLMAEVRILPGVLDLIDFYSKKNIPMAIASSSYMRLINIAVERLGIKEKIAVIHSAEYEKRGKPAPDIFLSTAKKLHINPEKCLVFEDSVHGVKAGKAAGMIVVAVPQPENYNNPNFDIADLKIHSLENLLTQNIIVK